MHSISNVLPYLSIHRYMSHLIVNNGQSLDYRTKQIPPQTYSLHLRDCEIGEKVKSQIDFTIDIILYLT